MSFSFPLDELTTFALDIFGLPAAYVAPDGTRTEDLLVILDRAQIETGGHMRGEYAEVYLAVADVATPETGGEIAIQDGETWTIGKGPQDSINRRIEGGFHVLRVKRAQRPAGG